jgi:hypothetical protein
MANLSNCDEEGQQHITEQVLQAGGRRFDSIDHSSFTSLVLTPLPVTQQGLDPGRGRGRGCGRGHPGGVILVTDVVVLAAGSPLKRAMPISIQSNLPHIILQFGTYLDCPNCPSIRCAVDLCAVLTMGNFHFFASVAKCYPHCVSKIYTPKDYAPIVFSGIVLSDAALITMELEVGFLFHLPYWTREGNSALLMVATGPNVSVNTIIGLPFMKATDDHEPCQQNRGMQVSRLSAVPSGFSPDLEPRACHEHWGYTNSPRIFLRSADQQNREP